VEIIFPFISIVILLGFLALSINTAVGELMNPSKQAVDVTYTFVFGAMNIIVNIFCWAFFYYANDMSIDIRSMYESISIHSDLSADDFGKLREPLTSTPGSLELLAISSSDAPCSCGLNCQSSIIGTTDYEDVFETYGMSMFINCNMMSSLLHLVFDMIYALEEFLTAFISYIGGFDSLLTDGYAAIIGAAIMILVCLYALKVIYITSRQLYKAREEFIEDSAYYFFSYSIGDSELL